MTPKEAFFLISKLPRRLVEERAERLNLAGGDGQKYLNDNAVFFDDNNDDDDFEQFSDFIYEIEIRNANAGGSNGTGNKQFNTST